MAVLEIDGRHRRRPDRRWSTAAGVGGGGGRRDAQEFPLWAFAAVSRAMSAASHNKIDADQCDGVENRTTAGTTNIEEKKLGKNPVTVGA